MASIFSERVWKIAHGIPKSKVTTYGRIARAAGGGGQAARSISSILSKAPKEYTIPFHRIVYSNGKVWCNKKYDPERKALYKKEGIMIDEKGKVVDFYEKLYKFN